MAIVAAAVADLIDDRLMPLGHGAPNVIVRDRLSALTPQSLVAPAEVKDADFAKACLAALWLWHDCLDEAHTIAQDIATAEGSGWHAIMHRREGDFWNSKYWFRRVGQHPAFAALNERLAALGLPAWEPMGFVDSCERATRDGGTLELTCRETQREEWRVLFEYCLERAV